MFGLEIMGTATSNETVVQIGFQHGQRYFAKAREQLRFRIMECLVEGGVHSLLDETIWRFRL